MLATLLLAAVLGPLYSFDPPAPTSQTFVFLRMRRYWAPCGPGVAQVTRDGNTFDVVFPPFSGGGCAGVVSRLDRRVPLGVLDPGEYTVVSHLPGLSPEVARLSVADATPALSFSEPFVSTAGDTRLSIRTDDVCVQDPVTVLIDGVLVPATASQCGAVVTAPRHGAGAVDVELRIGSESYVMRSTLRYVDPAAATPDEAVFERVLIPIIFSGGGGFGSQWVTEGEVVNRGAYPSTTLAGIRILFGDSFPIERFGSHPNGLLLALPRVYAGGLHFNTTVRDVSREDASWGVEVPVVHERDFKDAIELPNVAVDPRYRTAIRIYGIDGDATTMNLTVMRPSGAFVASASADLVPGGTGQPSFAMVDASAFRPPIPRGTYTITISPPTTFSRYWAMASVTNNATQHVTVITPR